MLDRTIFGNGGDQAEGLRRLLGRGAARVLTLEGAEPGAGASSVTVNLAAALAQRGLQVLVVDGAAGSGAAGALLGLRPRRELRDVLRGASAIDDALTRGPAGIMLLAAPGLQRGGLTAREHERLDSLMGGIAPRFDYLLLDVAGSGEAFTPTDTVVITSAAPSAITAAYARLKRAHTTDPRRRLQVLFNRVAAGARTDGVFANLKRVADIHLRAPLECLGSVPRDGQLVQAAARGHSVLDLFPAAPAAAAVRALAGRVAGVAPAPAVAPRPTPAPRVPFFTTHAIAPVGV